MNNKGKNFEAKKSPSQKIFFSENHQVPGKRRGFGNYGVRLLRIGWRPLCVSMVLGGDPRHAWCWWGIDSEEKKRTKSKTKKCMQLVLVA